MQIADLNKSFGLDQVDQSVSFRLEQGNLPFIQVCNQHANALISLYAGQVLSYRPNHTPEDVLFVSEKALYQVGKSIRGGIPICWPWFGTHPTDKQVPNHGFARNSLWHMLSTKSLADGSTAISMGLTADSVSKAVWPYEFKLQLTIIVGKTLNLMLTTYNTDQQAFSLTQALHTYFKVGAIEQVQVLGFAHSHYADKLENYADKMQLDSAISIDREVDRVYSVSPKITLQDKALNRKILINNQGSHSTVVWNPWIEVTAGMADLNQQDYLRFVCVETANARDDIITLEPQQSYSLQADYSVV